MRSGSQGAIGPGPGAETAPDRSARRRRSALPLLLVAFATVGCEREGDPLPQWVVHVGTDATVPGFGDRVRIDVLDPNGSACVDCTRVFDLAGGAALPLSFGVVPPESGVAWIRARLFRAEATDAFGEPIEPIIDAWGALPSTGDAPVGVLVPLTMACFGKGASPSDRRSCDPATGEYTTDHVFQPGEATSLPTAGSWGPGDEPCDGEPPPGMVCIEGGVFLLGTRTYVPFGPGFDPVPEQLVHVSPFFLDVDELTVAQYRAAGPLDAPAPATSAESAHCTYSTTPSGQEAASVNCISRDTADAVCRALGKRLPTEAEWEFAAGGRTRESPLPWWPFDDPSYESLCRQAVLARADENDASGLCILIEPGLETGPQPGGSPSDVSPLGLRNLGGNLSEWAADDYARYADPTCWGADLRLHENPRCANNPTQGVLRGGSWKSIPYDAHVTFRNGGPAAIREPRAGVRCAADAHD